MKKAKKPRVQKKDYNFSGTKNDQAWAKIKAIEYDVLKLEAIQALIRDGFLSEALNDTSERLDSKFIEPEIQKCENKIVKLYRELKLIK